MLSVTAHFGMSVCYYTFVYARAECYCAMLFEKPERKSQLWLTILDVATKMKSWFDAVSSILSDERVEPALGVGGDLMSM